MNIDISTIIVIGVVFGLLLAFALGQRSFNKYLVKENRRLTRQNRELEEAVLELVGPDEEDDDDDGDDDGESWKRGISPIHRSN